MKKIISIMAVWDEQNMISASIESTKDIVYELINNGADVNLTGKFKPLEVAKAQSIVNEEIIKKLIDNGAV